VSPFRWNFHFC